MFNDKFKNLIDIALKASEKIIDKNLIVALCLYGSHVSGYASPESDLDVILIAKNFNQKIKYFYIRDFTPIVSILVIDEKLFEQDVEQAYLGEFVAGRLFTPYYVIYGKEYINEMDLRLKRRTILELTENLILERKLLSTELLIKPEYFLFEKLRRRAAAYPPAKYSYLKILYGINGEKNLEFMLNGFRIALDKLVSEKLFEKINNFYSPKKELVLKMLKDLKTPVKVMEEGERIIKMYLTHGFAGRLNPRLILEEAYSKIKRSIKIGFEKDLPDPENYLFINTSLGFQPAGIEWSITEFVNKFYGISKKDFKIEKIGSLFNSTYLLNIPIKNKKIFVKKYLNWTDFKWIVAWMWTIGVRNFDILASDRMANEIHFINTLKKEDFNVPSILHINWKRKLLFEEYIPGIDLLSLWKNYEKNSKECEEAAFKTGINIAKVHKLNIAIGDCKAENFLLSNGKIYLTDLEQAEFNGDKAWDLAEMLFYPGHYLGTKKSIIFASSLIDGYLKEGDKEILASSMKLSYSRLLVPWTPPWIIKEVQKIVYEKIKK
jgi:tRNA A-37 threonylcarbamoyl transferase component Bud32/predicted nucleotidyltransferase